MVKNLSRGSHLAEKIIFIDGLPGCGKSLFSNIISSMDRVELLSYLYEVEHYCALHYLDKMPMDAAKVMIRMQTDLKLYNTMMGRDVNFRPTDLSSVIKNHDSSRYFQRLFEPGDEKIIENIKKKKPILNILVHNLLSYSDPIWEALEDRCVFIDVVRHPVYMIPQQTFHMKNVFGGARDFTIYYNYKNQEVPYYAYGWEDDYLKSNFLERSIYFTDEMTRRKRIRKKQLKNKYHAKILTIPFESFVLNPDFWIQNIASKIGSNATSATSRVMFEQKVPRKKVSEGLDLDLYRRYGWNASIDDMSEHDKLSVKRKDILNKVSREALSVLDRLSREYEEEFWNI